jgi:hypothetical protein
VGVEPGQPRLHDTNPYSKLRNHISLLELEELTVQPSRPVKALVFGLIALLMGALLSELVTSPAEGHRIDFTKLPPEAQAISNERPGVPISPEQWKRLDKIMAQHGGWPSGGDILLNSVRASWYWFLLLPAIGLGVLYMRCRVISLPEAVCISAPSLLLLSVAFLTATPLLKT